MKEKMTEKFFFDTYALIEIYKGNLNYRKYMQDVGMILTKLNILEFVYFLIREGKEKEISESIEKLNKYVVGYDDKILLNSAKMKYENKRERLSFVDCIGYFVAKKYNVKFLTGDIKFKTKESVEFVK